MEQNQTCLVPLGQDAAHLQGESGGCDREEGNDYPPDLPRQGATDQHHVVVDVGHGLVENPTKAEPGAGQVASALQILQQMSHLGADGATHHGGDVEQLLQRFGVSIGKGLGSSLGLEQYVPDLR